jgi:serine/threonine protein kinase/WD40 repeat protein
MAGEKSRKLTAKNRPDSKDIAEQSTRREQIEPSNQIILDESAYLSEGVITQKTGSRIGLPERIGQFQIIRELGRGGMGVVYLARQPNLNREVALKVLNINLQSDPEDAARFSSEAKLAASLQHPNIVQIYEIGEQDGYAFIAMEYVRGGSLHQHLKEYRPTPREAAELLEPLARAMQHAHLQGVIHRDLKPGNILISDAGTSNPGSKSDGATARTKAADSKFGIQNSAKSGTPKITDFGLAKNLNQSMHLTATGVALGTPSYMAPEQARDDRKNIGPCSDIYALGTILYEMLAGKPPFGGSTPLITMQQVVRSKPVPPSEIESLVPKDLEAICLKCLEKHPKKRYASAQNFADALRGFLDAPATEVISVREGSRRPVYIAAVAILFAVVAAAFAVWAYVTTTGNENKRQSARGDAERYYAENEAFRKTADEAKRSQFEQAMIQATLFGEEGNTDRAREILASLVEAKETIPDDHVRAVRINLAEWNEQTTRPFATTQKLPRANALAWSPDGKLLTSAGEDGRVRFFTKDGKESGKSLECKHGTIGGRRSAQSVAWSSKGDHIAVGGYVGHVYLFDVSKREAVGEPIKPEDLNREVWQTLFSRDGKTLTIAAADGGVRIFDVALRVWRNEFLPREPAGSYVAIALSPDDKYLAAGGKSGTLRISELKDGQPIDHRSWRLGSEIQAVAFGPDHRCLVAGTKAGSLFLWDRVSDRLFDLPPEASAIRAIEFGDGLTFATATDGGSVRIWDTSCRQSFHRPIVFDHPVRALALNGEHLLAVGDDRGAIRIFSVPRNPQEPAALRIDAGPDSAVLRVAYGKRPERLLSVSHADPRIWMNGDGAQIKLDQHDTLSGAMHPDSELVALGGRGGRLQLHFLAGERKAPATIESPMTGDVNVVAFSRDGSALLTIAHPETRVEKGASVNSAWVWKVNNPRNPRQVLESVTSTINAASWHPDSTRIALACEDGKVILWDLERNERSVMGFELGTPAQCVAVSGDGKWIAAGGSSGTGRIWNLDSGKEVSRSLYHSERILGIDFSLDSTIVLTGSHDKTARYWDAETGWPLGPPLRHPDAVLSAAFNPDGERAVTGCKDAAVRFWRLPTTK